MNAKQYRKSLNKHGLSQEAAARIFGVSLRTSQAYALGESNVPLSVALLLKLVDLRYATIKNLEELSHYLRHTRPSLQATLEGMKDS
jgi:transcriptional regulator with XRE-family HTH domain